MTLLIYVGYSAFVSLHVICEAHVQTMCKNSLSAI